MWIFTGGLALQMWMAQHGRQAQCYQVDDQGTPNRPKYHSRRPDSINVRTDYQLAYEEETLWHSDRPRDIRIVKHTPLLKWSYRYIQRTTSTLVRVQGDDEEIRYEESRWIREGQERKTKDTPEEIGWTSACEQGEEQVPFWKGCDSAERPWVSNVTL